MTQELFKNKYSPKTLDEYIGSSYETLKFYIEQALTNKIKSKGFILYGLPGTGKTTIVNVLANHYDMDISITNSSDDRNHINGNIIHTSSLLNDKKKLIIFDECDGLTDKAFKELDKIISNYSPIILICNDISKIPPHIKSKCFIKEIIVDKFSLKSLATKIIKEENLNINKDQLNKDLINIKSYRSLLDYLQFGYISEMESFSITENLENEIIFINDNSESPKLISLADIYMKRFRQGYKSGMKISKYIIDNIDIKDSKYPRTYKLIHEVKTGKSNTGIKILGFK